jgi:hypothetical protein
MAEVVELTDDLAAAKEEIEELKHNLTQAKINNDISQHEVLLIANDDIAIRALDQLMRKQTIFTATKN